MPANLRRYSSRRDMRSKIPTGIVAIQFTLREPAVFLQLHFESSLKKNYCLTVLIGSANLPTTTSLLKFLTSGIPVRSHKSQHSREDGNHRELTSLFVMSISNGDSALHIRKEVHTYIAIPITFSNGEGTRHLRRILPILNLKNS